MTDLRPSIAKSLQTFADRPLRQASLSLLETLGYRSDKTIELPDSDPAEFRQLIQDHDPDNRFNPEKALFEDWTAADLLFQLADDDISGQRSLFDGDRVDHGLLRSYLFVAVELSGDNYARGKLTTIARQINKVFPMPVMVLIKHRADNQPVLSIAVINRRRNRRDAHKDVLEKVTLIRDVALNEPHRGHLDILNSFAFCNLEHPNRLPINTFDALHESWERIFNVELLNKNFYEELANWFFWAKQHAHFPFYDPATDKYDLFSDQEKAREHEAKNLIRLLTRTLFVWFIKERGLVPSALFEPADLKQNVLKFFDSESKETHFYRAVLQNLFFATLNQTHGAREFRKKGQHHNVTTLLRYEDLLQSPAAFVKTLEAKTPFLNGGLFECLDRPHPTKTGSQGGKITVYEDGFSDRKDNPLRLPDFLFFGAERTEDLSGDDAFGIPSKRRAKVRGLMHILNNYKFTIVENTPIDQEIALDPELLGQVFENLLASYNPETKTTARKQTGSFYTPRPIVDYMVDESLKAHLKQALVKEAQMTEDSADAGLEILFAYTEKEHAFTPQETDVLIRAIDTCKILDPACGSGAFPMGALQKLVFILSKLDPGDELWERRQLAKVEAIIAAAEGFDDATFRERAIADAEAQRQDIEEAFANNELGYGRKLYLIENCLYGVDIQSIATQVTKLRFFISLIVDQKVDRRRNNFGVRPLPNLETKFVTADSLIRVECSGQLELESEAVADLQRELKRARHALFNAKTPSTKNKYRERDKELRLAIADELEANGWPSDAAARLAAWDPYDQNASAPYFDPEWMFGVSDFDVVIGNPPYIQIQKFPRVQKDLWVAQNYQTYAATADVYCLFYERGAELLAENGTLCYITSNKWMRAGYGEKLRSYLATQVDTHALLDFGMAQNFGAATTYTCITQLSQRPPQNSLRTCYATDDRAAMANPGGYFDAQAVTQHNISGMPWVVLSPDRFKIKQQVEAQGVPLEQWDLQIFRGVLTGYNDAFYLSQEQRDAFVAKDPRCAEFLVPLLRGRYVQRYATSWDGTWMIKTFPTLRLSFNDLPKPIQAHLQAFKPRLEPKPRNWHGKRWGGRKAGAYEWFETQDVIGYHQEFSKPKIIYQEIAVSLPFYFDRSSQMFMDTTCFMASSPSESLSFLTAVLNSTLFRCCFRDNFPEYSGNACRVKKIFMDKIPIKKPTGLEARLFEALVPLIQTAKAADEAVFAIFLEDVIDACVMECYFRAHMAERDLLLHDLVAPHLSDYDPSAPKADQLAFLKHLHATLNAPKHPVRNRLDRITTDSPDLLAVIKREGAV